MVQKETFDWQAACRKFNIGFGQMLKETVESRNDMTSEEMETYYHEACKAFKKFLRYYRSMNYFKIHDNGMLFSIILTVILVKKFNGKLMIDETGQKETVIELQTTEGHVSVNPFSLIRRTYDSEDWKGNRQLIEDICRPFSITRE